jgi:hypothetical protein
MAMAEKRTAWNGPQLVASWLETRARLPRPVCHAVFRETTTADGWSTATYRFRDRPSTLDHAAFGQELSGRNLIGPQALALSLLVIRETLDQSGTIQECTIERRRGAIDGPFFGDPARVEFIGPGRAMRLYRSDDRGLLVPARLAAQDEDFASSSAEKVESGIPSGDEAALREHFRSPVVVAAHRAPTLFEEAIGLSNIFGLRADGRDYRCGVGWHGPISYVLVANFPWIDVSPALPPDMETAVSAAIETHRLHRHETRFDANGLCVLATSADATRVFALRQTKAGVSVEPYQPSHDTVGSPDQRRWATYAEKYEDRVVLDAYQDGLSDDIHVLTGDADGQVWRHRINIDGVELAIDMANDTAIAALRTKGRSSAPLDPRMTTTRDPPVDNPAEADPSRAAALEAIVLVVRDARCLAIDDPAEMTHRLAMPLTILGTKRGLALARRLFAQKYLTTSAWFAALDRLEERLRQEIPDLHTHWMTDEISHEAFLAAHRPALLFHLDEARQCLASRRASAAMFHVAHLLRGGLEQISHERPEAWGDLLNRAVESGRFTPELIRSLRGIARRWRATGMTPAEKYTEEEAEVLLELTRNFLRMVSRSTTD